MIRDDSKQDGPIQKEAEKKDPEGITGQDPDGIAGQESDKKASDEEKGTYKTLKRLDIPPSVAPGSFIIVERDPKSQNGEGNEFTKRPTICFKPEEGVNVVYLPEEKVLRTIKSPKTKESDEDKE
jgi:hypothetical protein